MKKKLFPLLIVLPLLIPACAYQSLFKKPSFKSCKNEVSYEDFKVALAEAYNAHGFLGNQPDLHRDFVLEGYTYRNSSFELKTKKNKSLCKQSYIDNNQISLKYDKDSDVGSSSAKGSYTGSTSYLSHTSTKTTREKNINYSYVQADNAIDCVDAKYKQYLTYSTSLNAAEFMADMAKKYVSKTSLLAISTNYSLEDYGSKTKHYVDKDVFTVVYTNKIDNQSSNEQKTEDVVVEEIIKKQLVLGKEPIYMESHETKETIKYLFDSDMHVAGEISTNNQKDYIKYQVKFKTVKNKTVDYTSYENIGSVNY